MIGQFTFHYIVLFIDILLAAFFIWRVWDNKATLWGAAKIIYGWVAFTYAYHGFIYALTIRYQNLGDLLIDKLLHPFVFLFMLNALLVALIHYRGGHIL